MVQVFESHAGSLTPDLFEEFGLPYLRQIADGVRSTLRRAGEEELAKTPMVVFPKDGHFMLDQLFDAGYDVVSLDWTVKPKHARRLAANRVTLQVSGHKAFYSSSS